MKFLLMVIVQEMLGLVVELLTASQDEVTHLPSFNKFVPSQALGRAFHISWHCTFVVLKRMFFFQDLLQPLYSSPPSAVTSCMAACPQLEMAGLDNHSR